MWRRVWEAGRRIITALKLARHREIDVEVYVVNDTTVESIKNFCHGYHHEDFILVDCCVLRYSTIRNKIGIKFLAKSELIGHRFITDLKSEFPNLEENLRTKLK